MAEPVMIAVIVKDGAVRVLSAGVEVDCVIVNFDARAANMTSVALPEDLRGPPPPPEYFASVEGVTAEVDWLFIEQVYDIVAGHGHDAEEA